MNASAPIRGRGRLAALWRSIRLVLQAAGATVWVVAVVQVIGGFIAGAVIWSAGRVVAGLTGEVPDWSATWPWIAALAGLTTLAGLLTAVDTEQRALVTELANRDTTERVIDAAAVVPFSKFDLGGFYDLMNRAIEGARASATAMVFGTLGATRSMIDGAFIVVVLAVVAPVVIPIAVAAYVPLSAASRLSNRSSHRFLWDQTPRDRRRRYLASVFGGRADGREVRMFDLGTSFGGWHRELWDGRIGDLRKLLRARLGFAALGSFVSSTMTAVALGIVAWLAAQGRMSLADASVGILGVQRLSGIARALNGNLASLDRGGRQMRDYDRFIDEAHDARELLVGEEPPEHVDEIELHDVSFTYLDAPHPAVSELTTSIRSGEVTAVVGPNGSGKSTLMMLLCGLYEPDEGSISWDGRPVSLYQPEMFRAAIAPMFQDFTRFQLSVRDNVTMSEPDGRNDDVAIHEVLDIVGAGPAVDALGAGIDTELSRAWENGTELSAGQWQRLAAARALFRDAPLTLLDEPSADLDALAEQALIDELISRSADRCVVFISHRFSAVRKADRILVMHEGRLVEDGSHDELMEGAGLYSVMYRTQTGLDA